MTSKNKVIKRNGSIEDMNINKITMQLENAINGLDVDVSVFDDLIENISNTQYNISTNEIQEKLINFSKNMVSIDNSDMLIVAGRLKAYNTARMVWKNTNLAIPDYYESIQKNVNNGILREDILNMCNIEEFNELGKYLKSNREYDVTISQALLSEHSTLLKLDGKVVEYQSHVDMTNSLILASNEKNVVDVAKDYYDTLSKFQISLGTAFNNNLRIPNGNTGSCFVGEMDDNLYNIFKSYTDMAIISKSGGGIGWYFGKIRPGGTFSNGIPKANGIGKWIKFCNDIVVAVNQKGVRKGAITVGLDWWHLDILDFCEIKSELSGDLRDKSFDIFPQAIVDDYFVEKAKNKEFVYLYNQYEFFEKTSIDITQIIGDELKNAHILAEKMIENGELKSFKKIKANELWSKFLWSWVEFGGFYITHKDNLNVSNYLSGFGIAKCSNLCVESFSLTKPSTKWETNGNKHNIITKENDGLVHSCSLISINVANTMNIGGENDGLQNDEELEKVCKIAVRMLDSSITIGTMPIIEAKTSSELLRNIGIGCVGVGDYMAYNGMLYDTEEGLTFLESLYEKVSYFVYKASIELGKEKGSYPLHDKANYSKLFGKDPKELNRISPNGFDWVEIANNCKKHIRNFLLLAQAPNTSSALRQGVVANYAPAYSKETTQTLGNLNVPIMPKFIKNKFWGYKTKFQYKPQDIIRATKVCQRWLDTGISMELNLNPEMEPDISKISESILDAFSSKELKAVYYSITLSACSDCSN